MSDSVRPLYEDPQIQAFWDDLLLGVWNDPLFGADEYWRVYNELFVHLFTYGELPAAT